MACRVPGIASLAGDAVCREGKKGNAEKVEICRCLVAMPLGGRHRESIAGLTFDRKLRGLSKGK
jgi:hypothetical protein